MQKKNRGFTLIEVLIALAIISIALVAIIKVTGQSALHTAHLRDKVAAHWVAMNVLARMQIGLTPINNNDLNGEESMMGQEWHWQVKVAESALAFSRVEIKVMRKDRVYETLIGFVRRDL